jgi:hypothetical protein
MDLAKGITALFLLRQDDVGSSKKKQQNDSKQFLEEYCEEIRSAFPASKETRLEESFFILGRASMAVLLTCSSLYEISGVVMQIEGICRKMIEERGLKIRMSEPYCFPAVKINLDESVNSSTFDDNVVPMLNFIRTPEGAESFVQRVISTKEIREHARGLYLGLGMYDVILHLTFRNLNELGRVYNLMRASLGRLWESSTIIGVPRDRSNQQKERMQAASIQEIPFSISVKCLGGEDVAVAKRIRAMSRKRQYRHLFRQYGKKQNDVSLRQGYMDVEIRFKSNTVIEAFDFSCAIRRLEGVIDTCTLAGLPV